MEKPKSKNSQHQPAQKPSIDELLSKSLIRQVIQTARQDLDFTSRPYTPAESNRSLFQLQDYTTRPDSAYNPKNLKQEVQAAPSPLYAEPIITKRRSLSSLKPGQTGPVKIEARQEVEIPALRNVLDILKHMQEHEEVRGIYEQPLLRIEDLYEIGVDLQEALIEAQNIQNKPTWAQTTNVLSQLAQVVDVFSRQPGHMLCLSRILLENLIKFDLIYQKTKGKCVGTKLALGVVKLVYNLSKEKTNDQLFMQSNILEELHKVLVCVLCGEEIDAQGENLPFNLLVFVCGTLKNLTSNADLADAGNNLGLMGVVGHFLPTPGQQLYEGYRQELISSSRRSQLLVQITGIIRNLSKVSYEQILEFGMFTGLVYTISLFVKDIELVLNILRIVSYLSLDERILEIMCNQNCIKDFVQVMKIDNIAIVTRSCYILGNVLIYNGQITELESIEPTNILELANKKAQIQQYIGLDVLELAFSKGVLPNLQATNEEQLDCISKSLRLISNIILEETPDQALLLSILEKLLQIIQQFPDQSELSINCMSCLGNILLNEEECVLQNNEYCEEVFKSIAPFIYKEERDAISQSLRCQCILLRNSQVQPQVSPQILTQYLNLIISNHAEIVYYALVCIAGLQFGTNLLISNICLARMNIEEVLLNNNSKEIIELSLAVILNIVKGDFNEIEGFLKFKQDLVGVVEQIAQGKDQEISVLAEGVLMTLQDGLIVRILCDFEDCGRKFDTEEELEEHYRRRHSDQTVINLLLMLQASNIQQSVSMSKG